MKLLEYEAKDIFKKYGIPTAPSCVAETPIAARTFTEALGKPVVVKAQVAVGGRGKAGGIKSADSPEQVQEVADRILGMDLKGLMVRKVLVEERLSIVKELYLGVTVDRNEKCFAVLASASGGMDIEEVATIEPDKIIKLSVDPLNGLRVFHALRIAKKLGYSGYKLSQLAVIIQAIYKIAVEMDAELIEINPLAELADGFIAADGRLNIDNNALYRHKEQETRLLQSYEGELTAREMEARAMDLEYVELNGDIGIIGNGAGLTMATLDTVMLSGGKAGNFLDLGGGANPDRIGRAIEFILQDNRVKAVFVNVLGGITRCDDTANGIIAAQKKLNSKKPIVVRMMGTNENEGKRILAEAGITSHDTMEEAATMVVELARSV